MMKKSNNPSNSRKRDRGFAMSTKRPEPERSSSSGYSAKRVPLAMSTKPSAGYLLAKGPDGTRGFYSRSQKLNAKAHEFVPSSF
ncbi:hypothetical protein H310_01968 [Aphanomyces invadans]|uniref:Uncharacterized protein n=1 Tax=Aphanomyces invadans TaxID=157072 RepID=A0A024UMS3_9STRA|nr:hypothetical protein H310_01968 [Aphanomyces invadans]ETW07455.1 hypothetical protein H310_01968 [Aphanomyces invadans]|eukprot:XP_008863548.1 hypothetical protein H310_01968 [Aphanomyces invadans]